MKRSTKAKNLINKILSYCNLYLQKRNPGIDPIEQLITSFNYFNIDYVIDIGANVGQFSLELLENGYKGDIISFEPLTSAYTDLLKNSNKYENWTVYDKSAIGNLDGEIDINISNNSVSFPFFPLLSRVPNDLIQYKIDVSSMMGSGELLV